MTTLHADVLVIGGGATGAGVAWDCALRGYDTILVDRRDLAEGTSGRFHGLLHSGGRYVVKDPDAAVECVHENAIARRVAADAIEDTGGLFVTTPDDDPAYGDEFLAGCRKTDLPADEIPVAEALRREPRLNPGIQRAFSVPDGAVDVWKLVWALANGAAAHGARVLTYHRVVAIRREGDEVVGARLRNEISGEELDVEAAFTLNASGAWAAEVASMAGVEGVHVAPGKGIMIAMNHRLVNTVVNRCTMPADGDILVPIRTVSVIGTTDIRSKHADELPVTEEEVDQMLDDGERLVPGFRSARALRVWAGVRPLFEDKKTGGTDSTRDVSRSHALLDHAERDGLRRFLTITGGKLTTYRLMAQDTVDAMVRQRGDERPCRTAETPLPGSEDGRNYEIGSRLRHARAPPPGRAEHLRVRDGRARAARGGHAPARDAEPRRPPPRAAPGHGPVPGRLLHVPGGRAAARRGAARRAAGLGLAAPLPAGALEGHVADPLRRPAPAGAPGRLDLPGAARHRPPAGGSARPARAGGRRARTRRAGRMSHDVIVVGTGVAGLTAAVRLAEGGARVLVLAKGIGSTHLTGGTVDVLGYAPAPGSDGATAERVTAPGEALAGLPASHPVRAARRAGRGRRAGVAARAGRGERVRAVRLRRRAGGEPAAAHGGRRAQAHRDGAGDDARRRPARRRAGVHRRLPPAQGLPSRPGRRQPRRDGRWSRRAASSSTSPSPGART